MTGRIDTASRTIAAPAEAIFAAFTSPDALIAWLPPEGMTGIMHEFDLREGGAYRMELVYADPGSARAKSSENSDIVEARFGAIAPNRSLTQYVDFVSDDPAFSGTMTMTWALEPAAGGTLVTITAENVPSGITKPDHDAGLASSLANLARFVEG